MTALLARHVAAGHNPSRALQTSRQDLPATNYEVKDRPRRTTAGGNGRQPEKKQKQLSDL
jgi:hypothetical protein